MKSYKGVIKGNTVILEETPEGAEGAEAIVLLKVSEEEDRKIALAIYIITEQKSFSGSA